MRRACPITENSIHHVYSKSIYKFVIFTCDEEYKRFLTLISYYQFDGLPRCSDFLKRNNVLSQGFEKIFTEESQNHPRLVHVFAYCLMPTHVHLICREVRPNGITTYLRRMFNAYTRYFNLRHNRRGPLWECRFGNTCIQDDKHFETALAYVHNNPVEAELVKTPDQWPYSAVLNRTPGVGEVVGEVTCVHSMIPKSTFTKKKFDFWA